MVGAFSMKGGILGKMKKVFSLILVLALMVSMMPAVYAAEITDAAPPAEEATQPVESTESAPTTENQDPPEATEPPSEEMNVTEATETPEISEVTEPSEAPEEADATEATETTEATDATEPEVNEDPMMSQALIDSGFVTDQIQKKQVGIEDPAGVLRPVVHVAQTVHHKEELLAALATCDVIEGAGTGQSVLLLGHLLDEGHIAHLLLTVAGGGDGGSGHVGGDLLHARLGVTVCGRRVAVHRTEVTLTLDQNVAHIEGLCHVYHCAVHRGITVRMVPRQHRTDGGRRLVEGLIVGQMILVHGVQHAALTRLHAVAHVGKRAGHDNGHGVFDEGLAYLLFHIHIYNFLLRKLQRMGGIRIDLFQNVSPFGKIVLCMIRLRR